MHSNDDSGPVVDEACTDLSPEVRAQAVENFRAVARCYAREFNISQEHAYKLVEQRLDSYLARVTQYYGRIPDDLVEQHCATFLGFLAQDVAEYEAQFVRLN